MDAFAYFAAPGPITDLGPHARLCTGLPAEVAALTRVVQGWLVHIFWAERYGLQLSDERKSEVQLRFVSAQLDRLLELDPRPLPEARPIERRLVGNCRDFAVLLTALLRRAGVPARARCGFGRYFTPGRYEDHWVCEYWRASQRRWVLVDAQLDALQREALSPAFDPLDVPRDQFIVGGQGWQLCRSGQADPETFGIFDLKGLWFVRGNLVRDLAALNKWELLPWDSWGLCETPESELTPEDLALLDKAAALTCGDAPDFEHVRALYEGEARLRVPPTIRSYTAGGVRTVHLPVELEAAAP
jgi:hypothetical protein